MLLVEQTGPMVTIQDLGRPGWLSAGVGPSGAADRGSLRLANRLVGNAESAACLEILLGGVGLRALRRVTVAVTGAPAPIDVDGRPMGHASVLDLPPGSTLRLGLAAAGLRSYLGIRGGIDVPQVLGSRSRDTLSGLGPEPVRVGDTLSVGPPPNEWSEIDVAPVATMTNNIVTADVVLGPRDDWFVHAEALFEGVWRCSTDLDRVGMRLDRVDGPPLDRAQHRELPSEGTVLGAIQVPPDGRPVVFLADHPVTGGYPVIGVVVDAHIDRLAQVRPGQLIRFRQYFQSSVACMRKTLYGFHSEIVK